MSHNLASLLVQHEAILHLCLVQQGEHQLHPPETVQSTVKYISVLWLHVPASFGGMTHVLDLT